MDSTLSRATYLYAITLLYLLVAASTVDVFMTKWTTVINHPQYSLEKTLAMTTPKPYAFRLLMPIVVNKTFEFLPDKVLQVFSLRARLARDRYLSSDTLRYLYNSDSTAHPWSNELIIKYGLCGMWFFALFSATLLLYRSLANHVSSSRLVCDGSPIIFALALPLSFRAVGGFIYDFSELFLVSLYLWLVLRNRRMWALALLPLAVLNKETAILWPLLILLPYTFVMNREKALRDTALHITLCGVVLIGLYWFLRDVEGSHADFLQLVSNAGFWLNPRTYLLGLSTGLPLIPFPRPQHVIFLPFLLILFFAYWSEKPQWLRLATTIGFAIVLPLVILFCFKDEYRNFSLLFPVLFLNSVHTMHSYFSKSEAGVERTTETASARTFVRMPNGDVEEGKKIYMPGPSES